MNREPLVTVASITGLVAAVLALLVAFGLNLTDDQQKAILGVAAVVAPFVVAAFVRPRVTPVAPAAPAGGRHRGEVGAGEGRFVALVALGVLVAFLIVWLLLEIFTRA